MSTATVTITGVQKTTIRIIACIVKEYESVDGFTRRDTCHTPDTTVDFLKYFFVKEPQNGYTANLTMIIKLSYRPNAVSYTHLIKQKVQDKYR